MKISQYFHHIQQKNRHLRSYYVLAVLRVFLVFVPQFGYLHPDEFFQSLEVMAGKLSLIEVFLLLTTFN